MNDRYKMLCCEYSTHGILLISLIATAGSLYLSLGMGLLPCQLCWYQRILMYPLVLIMLYSLVTQKQLFGIPLVFSFIGGSIAAYHSMIQRISVDSACSDFCAAVLFQVGPLTIPNLSLIAFTGIFLISGYRISEMIPFR